MSSDAWLISRRYSLERRDNVYLLHVARVLQVLHRANDINPKITPELISAITRLEKAMVPGVQTVEALSTSSNAHNGEINQLSYQRGYSFWADGANLPFNYESGWIAGVASSANPLAVKELFVAASAISKRHWENMRISETPQTWSYSDGILARGWSQ